MVQTRKERKSAQIPLAHPDRSGPSGKTLLDLAQERNLFEQADLRQRSLGKKQAARSDDAEDEEEEEEEEEEMSPLATRILDTMLWSMSLTMLHFTLDVLVQHQYAVELSWPTVIVRTAQALFVFASLFYVLHLHPSDPTLIPGMPDSYQSPLRQAIFFIASASSGCYLIHISNTYGYLAVMKQAPPLGCLWVWSVIELDLLPAALSLGCCLLYLWYGGYKITGYPQH